MQIASDIAFTPSVKAEQAKRGSRLQYERMERSRGWPSTVTPDLTAFIADARSFYLATASAEGQPYIQHRGGPAGFLKILDDKTLAFADYVGNRQYITIGNLANNPKAYIFIMDYVLQRRVKLWGYGQDNRRRRRPSLEAKQSRLSRAAGARDRLHHRSLGPELSATYSADAAV